MEHASQLDSLPKAVPLTTEQRALITATVPVLLEHGSEITRLFYATMLDQNPELKNTFNLAKQQQGGQADALARAVLAYAQNIDDPTPLLPVVERIAHKHASLHILPQQYAIVGRYLLEAIAQVVGANVFSGALYDAWGAAYWQLAHIFIDREAQLYNGALWHGWKSFTVRDRLQETEDVASFYFVSGDGSVLPAFKPGQYISVRVWVEQLGFYQTRQYSLSDAPSSDHLRISVKREGGVAPGHPGWISNLLHDTLKVGNTLELSPPFGEFFLDPASSTPIVLLAAGIGCTPLMSMLETSLRTSDRAVRWVQVVRDGVHHPFKAQLAALRQAHSTRLTSTVFYSNPRADDGGFDFTGRMDLDKAVLPLEPNVEFFVCGTDGFMLDTIRTLKARGVANDKVHAEVFGAGAVPES